MKRLLIIEPNHTIRELVTILPVSPLRNDMRLDPIEKHFIKMSWLNFQYKEIIKE